MKKIAINIKNPATTSYNVLIQAGLLHHLHNLIPKQFKTIVIITDSTVKEYYLNTVLQNFKKKIIKFCLW